MDCVDGSPATHPSLQRRRRRAPVVSQWQQAAAIYRRLEQTSLAPAEYRAFPRCALPLDAYADTPATLTLPPLIKGYLRVGAQVCGAPAWDPDFNTADLLMMLPVARMAPRYPRHLLRA
jgi:putative hemolysin